MLSFKSFLLLSVVGLAAASPLSLDEDFDAEGRLFTTTNGGFSMSNATFNPGSILALLLLGILFFVTVGQGFLGGSAGGSGYGYSQRNSYGYDNDQFYARSDQFANNKEQELAQLLDSLDKTMESFNVELDECKVYVACEASQVNKHETNGDLAREVDAVMRRLRQHPTPLRNRALIEAFNFGDASYKQKKTDSCAWFGDQCTAARKATKGF